MRQKFPLIDEVYHPILWIWAGHVTQTREDSRSDNVQFPAQPQQALEHLILLSKTLYLSEYRPEAACWGMRDHVEASWISFTNILCDCTGTSKPRRDQLNSAHINRTTPPTYRMVCKNNYSLLDEVKFCDRLLHGFLWPEVIDAVYHAHLSS